MSYLHPVGGDRRHSPVDLVVADLGDPGLWVASHIHVVGHGGPGGNVRGV